MTNSRHTLSLHDALPISAIPDVIHLESAPATAPETVLDIQPDPGETPAAQHPAAAAAGLEARSEEHTSELQSRFDLVCRLLLEKKKNSMLCITTSRKQIR